METKTVVGNQNRIEGSAGHIFVDDGGKGDITVVFAHSFGGSSAHWNEQLKHLRKNRRAIALDFRGHGKSDEPADHNFSAEGLAGDIEAVVNDLGLEKFVLVGHSMGGAAAIAYAGKNLNKLAGLVLVGAPGKSAPEQSKQIISSLESDAYQKVMDQYMEQLLANAKPEVNDLIMKGVDKVSKKNSLNIVKAMFEFDPIPSLKKYNGPKLIISTTREKSQPNSLPNQMPDIPTKVVDGTSHWVQLDKAEDFNKILDEFLKSIK